MITADILHPGELPEADAQAWRGLCEAQPLFASPLLGPDFARAVGEVREDAAVAVFRRGGDAVGFLPHHRRPMGLARAIGAPFSDLHALVTGPRPPASGPDLLAAAKLDSWRVTGLVDPHGLFAASRFQTRRAHLIAVAGDAEAHLEAIREASPKKFKNYRRLEHKLERDHGDLAFAGPDVSLDAFELLLAWKREQLVRTGLHDFLQPGWTRDLMERLYRRRDGAFQGALLTLRAGGRLVAGHFGVRCGTAFHPWIAAADPCLAAYSPGHIFLRRAILAMPELGLTEYDLSAGHDHYKAQYASREVRLLDGQAYAPTAGGRYAASRALAWRTGGASRIPGVARIGRRLEHIATVELSLPGRLRGVAGAVASAARRNGHLSQAAPLAVLGGAL